MFRSLAIPICAFLPAVLAASGNLSNARVTANFNNRGLASLNDRAAHFTWRFPKDEFSITLGGRNYTSESLGAPTRKNQETSVTYSYTAGPYQLDSVYELRPTGRFIIKRLIVTAAPGKFRIDEIAVFRAAVAGAVRDVSILNRGRENLGTGDYGAFLRFEPSRGLLVTAQNPFLAFHREGNDFSLAYKPAMEWDMSWGAFESDRGLLAPYELSGNHQPGQMLPEWWLGVVRREQQQIHPGRIFREQ